MLICQLYIFHPFDCFPAVSEVSGMLQPSMVLFSTGREEDEKLQVQSLDSVLAHSPTQPPPYKLRKEFNGEALQCWCMCVGVRLYSYVIFLSYILLDFDCSTFLSSASLYLLE